MSPPTSSIKRVDSNPIRLRKEQKIGALDAESDVELLQECFVESDDFRRLIDVNNPLSVVLGRTGAGKSALLLRIGEKAHTKIWLDPGAFSFHYIENSTILKFVEGLGPLEKLKQ